MNIEDYKELMVFYILLSDVDLLESKYAAVDSDGGLWSYYTKPYISEYRWENKGRPNVCNVKTAFRITKMTPPDNWKEALIEL